VEIKFVVKKLHFLLNKSNNTDLNNSDSHASADIDHDNLIGKNFWGYIKRFFKKSTSSLPSFNIAQCTSYFTKTFSAISPNKTFNIPSWIPKFASPQSLLILTPPPPPPPPDLSRDYKRHP
jgi:hypothetical protein